MIRPLVTSRRTRALALAPAIALSIALSGCGGSGEGPATVSPPPPAPPPPPPPPQEVLPFPAAQPPATYPMDEVTGSAVIAIRNLPGDQVKIAGITDMKDIGPPNRNGATITYEGPDRYSIEFNGFGGPSFAPAALRGSGGPYAVFRNPKVPGYVDNLSLARPDVGVDLTYATFGAAETLYPSGATSTADITFFAAGSRTPAGQMPTTGTATMRGIADGLWVDGATVRRLYGSTATLAVDFARGEVTSTLELRGHADPFKDFAAAPTTRLGTFTGTGRISGSGFAGSYAPKAGYAGPFDGHFYGPKAEEFGLAFKLTGGPDQSVFGVAVGKKR